MEVIAEINDLACQSIEYGDYQTALDVLNCCLGCVKQLKKCRSSVTKDQSETRHKNIVDLRHTATKETVLRLLKGAKRRLMNQSIAAIRSDANTGHKRKPLDCQSIQRPGTKRRRLSHEDTMNRSHSQPDAGVSDPDSKSSFSTADTACPSMSSPTETDSDVHTNLTCNHHCKIYDCSSCQNLESEDRYFVYGKPLRLTKFQWSRIAESQSSLTREGDRQNIDREVELAVSSNLIFNIALSHHLIASSKGNDRRNHRRSRPITAFGTSVSSDEDETSESSEDDTSDDEAGCGYDSCDETTLFNTLRTEQRLKGALRLYELGFRVHTKRVAYVTSSQQSCRDGSPPAHPRSSMFPSWSASAVSNNTPSANLTRAHRRLTSSNTLPEENPSNTDHQACDPTTDRDDELKSTTRFALALLNNCAHIHQELGQIEKAKVFQKRLLSFLLVIVDSGESIYDIIGDDPAVDGYLKNVFAGTVFDKSTAPAAVA